MKNKSQNSRNSLLSIIIPVYNAESCIRACVDSILGQSFSDYELVLVDDGSTDASVAICDDYARCANLKLRVIHKNNGGASSARNTGLDKATGKYIVFVDSDDTLPAGALATMAKHAEQSTADIVAFAYRSIRVGGDESVCRHSGAQYSWDEALRRILCYKLPTPPWAKTYRHSLFESVEFDPDIIIGEDAFLNMSCFVRNQSSIQLIDECVYNYIQRPSSVSYSGDHFARYVKLSDSVKSLLSTNGLYDKFRSEYAVFDIINIVQAAFKTTKIPSKELLDRLAENYCHCNPESSPEGVGMEIARRISANRNLGLMYLRYRLARTKIKRAVFGKYA